MRKFTALLLASATFAAVPAMAQQSNTPTAADSDEQVIVVFGKGETRQVQDVTSKELLILAPGTSPLKAIEKLPSVNSSQLIHSALMNGQAAYRSAGSTRTSLATH